MTRKGQGRQKAVNTHIDQDSGYNKSIGGRLKWLIGSIKSQAYKYICPCPLDIIVNVVQLLLSSGYPTTQASNQSPQLQRLARKLKFHLEQVFI